MILNSHNIKNKDHKLFENFKDNNFFFEEFESSYFFRPILEKNYYKRYDIKKFINKKNKVHVFGMGGSSLSAKLLIQFVNSKVLNSKLFIYDNPYDELIEEKLNNHQIDNYDKFIFISKSGKTEETKYFLMFLERYLKINDIKDYKKNFIFITEDNTEFLRKYGHKNNITCIDHDPNIGGRFSIFSITAYLPLLLIGYSLPMLLKEAKSAFSEIKKNKKKIAKFLLDYYSTQKKNKTNIFIGLSYSHKLVAINEWYRQIFAESLGKNNNSITYIMSPGPIDQHSQFQLYIDGPQDKSYIFFKIINKNKLHNNLLKTLLDGATKTLIDKGSLVSSISINNTHDSYNQLIILLIFDIFLRSKAEKINFLNQPAVEILKKNTKI